MKTKSIICALLTVSFSNLVTAEKRCTSNDRKCLEVAETDYDEGTTNKIRVKYNWSPFTKEENYPEIWVLPQGVEPTPEDALMTKRIIRRQGSVLLSISSLIAQMDDPTGGYIDIYLASKNRATKVKSTKMTVGVWSITSSPTSAPTTYVIKFEGIHLKEISLNNTPGRKLTLANGANAVSIKGQRTGWCTDYCPGCVKIARLKMFDPNGNMTEEKCIMSHGGSQCNWTAMGPYSFQVNPNISGVWEIQVWTRLAYCTTPNINYRGVLAWITVP